MVKGRDNGKGKAPKDGGEGRYYWTEEDVELLINLLVQEASVQIGRGGSLVGFQHKWITITEKFNALRKDEPPLKPSILKNKGDTLKTNWRKWKDLTFKKTGLGWNLERNCPRYPKEWIARACKEDKGIAKLVNSKWPSHLVDEMELIWGQSYANGELRVNPGGEFPEQQPQQEDDSADEEHNEPQEEPYMPSAHISYSNTGSGCHSMDISNNFDLSPAFPACGSNRNRVSAPPPTAEVENNINPVFDMNTAASLGARLVAESFQGSPYAGIVAGGSNSFQQLLDVTQPEIINLGDSTDPEQVKMSQFMGSQVDRQTGKPEEWDDFVKTEPDSRPHGARKQKLQPVKDIGKGKNETRGSKGKGAAGEELVELNGKIGATLTNCNDMLSGLRSHALNQYYVVDIHEAIARVRSVYGIPRRHLIYASIMLAQREHKAVLMMQETDEEVAEWCEMLYHSRNNDNE